MNDDDYAIVVGIRRYPTFRPPMPGDAHDLDGPDRDATDIYDWLTDPNKGGVPSDQALNIRSGNYPDPFLPNKTPEPNERTLVGAMVWLESRPKRRPRGRIGRRLYFYFSGHGFGTKRNAGGIYTAVASPLTLDHFFATAWLDWLYDAALFEEYVLWFDACMTKIPIHAPRLPHFFTRTSPDRGEGRAFTAFSARHPTKSVERTMPDGKVHGAFTYALLKGLNGDAADRQTGLITTSNLKDHLINTMKSWMSQDDLDDPDVSNEPDFGLTDELEFGRVARPQKAVRFVFAPAANGSIVNIETGQFVPVARGRVQNGKWQTQLENGIYRVSVAATGNSRIFEIRRDQDAVIDVP